MEASATTRTASRASSPDAPVDAASDGLESIEVELTRDVPAMLEAMNSSSSEVNWLESEAATAQHQYQQSLSDWTSLSEQMRTKHGHTFDAVRPYFDAVHRARTASQRAQGIVKVFSAASSQCSQANKELRKIEESLAYGAHSISLDAEQQEGLSRATVRALKNQQERDRSEREYANVLREYNDAKTAAEKCRVEVGKEKIQRMVPCFRQLQQSQLHLDERRKHLSALTERIRIAKNTYNQSMRSLDRISTAVHHARREYKDKAAAKVQEDPAQTCPEQDHPAAETAEAFAFGDCVKTADNALSADNFQTVPEITRLDSVELRSPFA